MRFSAFFVWGAEVFQRGTSVLPFSLLFTKEGAKHHDVDLKKCQTFIRRT